MKARRKTAKVDAFARLGQARAAFLLDERTRKLAEARDEGLQTRPTEAMLACPVGENLFGIPLGQAARVRRFERAGAAPSQARGFLGLAGEAGRILPILDLAVLLGISGSASPDGFLVVLNAPRNASLRLSALPSAVDVEPVDGDPDRGRVVTSGEFENRILTRLKLDELLPASASATNTFGD